MGGYRLGPLGLVGCVGAAVIVASGVTWLFVEGLQLFWEDLGFFAFLLIAVRIVALCMMPIGLVIGIRAVVRAMTSRLHASALNNAITFYAIAVAYATFGMMLPMVGVAYLEPAVYLSIALLLLIAVRVGTLSGRDKSMAGSQINLSLPDTRRAGGLTLLTAAALLGVAMMYGWFALRGDLVECFGAGNCSTDVTFGVLAAMTTAGILTAGVVLWSLHAPARVTRLGVIATTMYACLALIGFGAPLSTLVPYDFVAVAVWHAIASLALLVCQSSFEDDPWPLPTHLVMEPWSPPTFAPRQETA